MNRPRGTGYFPTNASVCKANQANRVEELLSQFYLSKARLNYQTCTLFNDWCSVGYATAQGWRSNQEDAHLVDLNISPDQALFGVFDGHNGVEVAQFAANTLPEYLKRNANFKQCNYVEALQESFLEIDEMLLSEKVNNDLQLLREKLQGDCFDYVLPPSRRQTPIVSLQTGSTAIAVLINENKQIHVANIGDSRCIMTIKDKVVALSEDHKPTNSVEKKRIEQAGCYVEAGRINHCLNLSRALGDHIFKNNPTLSASRQAISAFPDVTICDGRKMKNDDFIVIACDGIWNCMSNKKVAAFVKKYIKQNCSLSDIAKKLIAKCISPTRPMNGKPGGDNMTCMIVKFHT